MDFRGHGRHSRHPDLARCLGHWQHLRPLTMEIGRGAMLRGRVWIPRDSRSMSTTIQTAQQICNALATTSTLRFDYILI